ncbi:YadA-like family protein [Acinetobacter pseudolwoffii]|nr:YadA-like family protein [Acinetobacter pseudolwoffii]
MTGQLVNTELTGRDGIDPEEEIAAAYPLEQLEPTGSLVKKDIEIGNLTKESLDSTSNRDFTIAGDNVYGTVATAAASTTTTVTSTSVTGLTGNGLTVVDAPVGSIVDLEKGTVTTVKLSDDAVTTRAELQAFATEDGARVFEIQNKYYQVEGNKLVDFKGDVDELTLVGAGVSDTTTGGSVDTLVNTGFVSSQNVTYGESKTSVVNGTSINVASTNPNVANPESGDVYQVTAAGQTTSSSKDVKTGIIAVDQAGNKTYGLQATNTTDGKVTAQTTVTAAGIETTGDIAFVDAATGAKTSVKGYLEETSKAVDAKVDAALVEVDSRLTQFNSTAARLNSRIDDVEKTAYRGVAIALAAQQQIPNIGAGQFAVFGGVGHYEGESAGALGVASVFADGRTSVSAALGFAGGNEVGGRVGVSYVFGGK